MTGTVANGEQVGGVRSFLPAVEGMRACAAMGVVVTHVAFQTGHSVGASGRLSAGPAADAKKPSLSRRPVRARPVKPAPASRRNRRRSPVQEDGRMRSAIGEGLRFSRR